MKARAPARHSTAGAGVTILQRLEKWLGRPFGTGMAAVMLTWGSYFVFVWPRMLYRQGETVVAGWGGVFGDWMVHFSYAAPFAYRPTSDWLLGQPLYHGYPFMYPFAADALSGLLIQAGVDFIPAFIVPSLVTTLALLVALYVFYFMQVRSALTAGLALSIFLTSGGLGLLVFVSDWSSYVQSDAFPFPLREYTVVNGSHIVWSNVVTGQLIPQRPLLLGMAAALGLFFWLYRAWRRNWRGHAWWLVGGAGAVSGTMVVVHVHSYMVVVAVCLIMALLAPRQWRQWAVLALGAAAVAVPLYLLFYHQGLDTQYLRWLPGWRVADERRAVGVVRFWLLNWGLFLPIALYAVVRLHLFRNPFIVAGLAVFVAANLIVFQPYVVANEKLFIWSYLFLSLPVAHWLAGLWQSRRRIVWMRGLALALLIILTASGALDLWRLTFTSRLSAQLWSPSDLALAEEFRALSQPTDVVLASPVHLHWLVTHTGRPTLLGYTGWLWTYGIDYGQRERDIRVMYAGGEEAERLFDEYGVSYVVIDVAAAALLGAREDYFRERHRQVLATEDYRVYALQ